MTHESDANANNGDSDDGAEGANTLLSRDAQNNFGKTRNPMEALLKQGASPRFLKVGDIVEGTVIEKKGTRLFVDLGPLGCGIVYGREYYAAQDIIKDLHEGDSIGGKIVELDNEEGYIELSLREAGRERRWIDLKTMQNQGTIIEVSPVKANTGGLIISFMGIEGFLPASQLSFKHYPRVEGGDKEKIFHELQKLVDETLKVKVLDVNQAENKLILTEKGADQDFLKEVVARYHPEDIVEGEITGVVDFGAFMKFDDAGLEGLIHLSEIDWTLVENPRDALKPGDKIKAKIIDIQGDKVSLSLKRLKNDPWLKAAEKYKKGDEVQGKVTKLNPFGAFIQLDDDIQGLAHISEFGSEPRMRESLEVGRKYPFVIFSIDPKERRISLGVMKKGSEPAESGEEKTGEKA